MVIVISLGAVITGIAYLLGFIFVVYIIEKIVSSINEILIALNINFLYANNFSIELFILLLLIVIVTLRAKGDSKQHKNENNEMVHRRDWQKLLGLVNIVMIYPVLKFYEEMSIIDNRQKIYMLGYAVLFLMVFVLSHYYIYINTNYSSFDKMCFHLFKIITFLASSFIAILVLSIYSLVIYLHDFLNLRNILIFVFYYAFLILPTILFSIIFFPSSSKNQKTKTIITDHIFLIISSIILGFSPVYNIFIKNGSIYSIHSLILIDIILILVISILLLPFKLKKSGNGA